MMDEKNGVNKDEEEYQRFLNESLQDFKSSQTLTEEGQMQIIKTGKGRARRTNIMISLAILLLIVPVMTLGTYLYYAIGGKANNLIEVASKTIYVTEPNMSLEEMEIEEDIGFFSMNIMFDVYKKIGREDYKYGDYNIHFALDEPNFPEKNLLLDRPLSEIPEKESEVLLHPQSVIPFSIQSQWDILNGLPDGTVAEVYVSLTDLMEPDELKEKLPPNTELRWLAVDTGMEAGQVDKEGIPITPLGFPAQIDSTTWSPFNGSDQTNEEVFLDIVEFLEKNEAVAEKIARAKSLALQERRAYVEKNGIKIYGAVITGSTAELRKLEKQKEIRAMKVGEVKLWN